MAFKDGHVASPRLVSEPHRAVSPPCGASKTRPRTPQSGLAALWRLQDSPQNPTERSHRLVASPRLVPEPHRAVSPPCGASKTRPRTPQSGLAALWRLQDSSQNPTERSRRLVASPRPVPGSHRAVSPPCGVSKTRPRTPQSGLTALWRLQDSSQNPTGRSYRLVASPQSAPGSHRAVSPPCGGTTTCSRLPQGGPAGTFAPPKTKKAVPSHVHMTGNSPFERLTARRSSRSAP